MEGDNRPVSGKLNESNLNKKTSKKVDDSMNKSKESIYSREDYKFEIPDRCYLTLMKGAKIEKLFKKYSLLVHPYPKIEGEMIIV